jgi:lysophospholipase L1-like esterase
MMFSPQTHSRFWNSRIVDAGRSMATFLLLLGLLFAFDNPSWAQEVASKASSVDSLELPTDVEKQIGVGPLRQADWFQGLWKSRRTDFAKAKDADQGALVLYGDSITQGWPDLKAAFPGVKVANRGISGDTTRGMLIRLQGDVIALNPKGVVLLMGTNDIEENASPETIAQNVTSVVAELKKHNPDMPIVLCLILPSSETKSRPTATIQATNKLLLRAVRGDKQITVLDTFSLYKNEVGDATPELFPDLLHLNPQGYAVWAAALRPVLATLGFMETEPEKFKMEPGFVSLFNGKDLTGWGFLPTPPMAPNNNPDGPVFPVVEKAIAFEGQTASSDGRYVAKNGRLIVTTPSEGSRIQQLWTTKEFPKNFVLKLEFRATPNADSGIFIRQPQLQCRDYPLAGPYKNLKKYRPLGWNEIEIKVQGGKAYCTCNGEVLEAEFPVPSTGPIGLEGDRGQMEYRRIRIQELE